MKIRANPQWIVKKISNFALIIFIFLLSMEIAARIDDKVKYDAPFFSKYTYGNMIAEDDNRIRYNVPYSHYEKWRINNLGFRGHNISPSKPQGTVRVVCMGSSESFGLYEDRNKEWPSQLREVLKKKNNLQILNSSVMGQFLDNFEPYIDRYVLKWDPDVIILHLNFYSYSTGIDKKRNLKKKNRNEDLTFKNASAALLANGYDSIRIFPKIKQKVKKLIPPSLYAKYETWKMQKEITELENKLNQQPSDTIDTVNLEEFRTDLKNLITYLQGKGIKVVLSSYPSLLTAHNMQSYTHVFLDARRFCVKLSFRGMIDASMKFNNEIRSVAEECGAFYVDVDSSLPKTMEFFGDNIHYTNQGAAIIAARMADLIENQIIKE